MFWKGSGSGGDIVINSNSNVFCIQALVPLEIMFFGALFQE